MLAPQLFEDPRQPDTLRERPGIYEAILKLRRAGKSVTRAGRTHHRVDGLLLNNKGLLMLAEYVP